VAGSCEQVTVNNERWGIASQKGLFSMELIS
jgi:hypothetical protein